MVTIIEDTRQQAEKHRLKHKWFDEHGVKVVRSKLPAADYALLSDMSRVIDSKQGLMEIYGNLTQDHERIRRECDFCKDNGIELIILIEEPGITCLDDVRKWSNPRLHKWNKIRYMHEHGRWLNTPLPAKPPVSNITLIKIMHTFGIKHGVRWEFCDPADSGRRIIELLMEGKNEETQL